MERHFDYVDKATPPHTHQYTIPVEWDSQAPVPTHVRNAGDYLSDKLRHDVVELRNSVTKLRCVCGSEMERK